MNRAQRRAAAAKMRHAAIADALAVIAALGDSDVTGATLILPDGDVVHLDAGALRAKRQAGEGVH